MSTQKWKKRAAVAVISTFLCGAAIAPHSYAAEKKQTTDAGMGPVIEYVQQLQFQICSLVADKYGLQSGKLDLLNQLQKWIATYPSVLQPKPTQAPTATPKPTQAPTATPKPTQAPTATPKPTQAPTATPKPTQAPTATPKPTQAPTATPKPSPTNNGGQATIDEQILNLVNQERQKLGLKDLKLDSLLSKVATEKARDMDENNYFSHTSPTYGSPFDMMASYGVSYRYAGENIASGYTSAEAVMKGWMNSPGHRANIVNANFTKLGVGKVNGQWVQMFIG